MKLKLTITVDYETRGATRAELEWALGDCAKRLYDHGLLSNGTDAEVKEWDWCVEGVWPEKEEGKP